MAVSYELNLVPLVDIMVNVLIFLVLNFSAMKFSIVPTTLPVSSEEAAVATEQVEEEKKEEKPKLNLTVSITREGFTIAGSGGVLVQGTGPTIPKKSDGTYDYEKLNQLMIDIKKRFPWEQDVIIIPEMRLSPNTTSVDIPYQVIMDTMDAVREAPEPITDSNGDGIPDSKALFSGVIFSVGIF
jgi:biopolymer transport protein ExbD